MRIKTFFEFVEIRTKVASLIPFITGVLYSVFRYDNFKPWNTLIFFLSLLLLDMGTTALNHYMDGKRAIKKSGYNYSVHNPVTREGLSDRSSLIAIFSLFILSFVLGVLLFIRTDIFLLCFGIIGFLTGISYSYGPLPLSTTPLGELFSGVIMGGLIFFISIYVNSTGSILGFELNKSHFILVMEYRELIAIAVSALPFVFTISNIMLSNNICDLEEDIENRRFTLVYFLGIKRSLILYVILYILTYLALVTAVIIQSLPVVSLIVLLTIIPVTPLLVNFVKKQDKKTTFVNSIKVFLAISTFYIISLVISLFIH